jgi:tape measure domain-containing protein
MANENRVELVIRAKDLAKKSIADLADTIDRLQSELEQVDRAGGPASRSVAELKQQLADLKTVGDEIGRRKVLVEQFNLQGAAVARLSDQLDKAKAAYNAHRDAMSGAAKASKEQKDTLRELDSAVKAANTGYQRAAGAMGRMQREMADLGLSTQTAAADLATLTKAEQRLDAQQVKAETNLRTRDAALRSIAESTKAKAQADKAQAQSLKAVADLQDTVAAGAERLARARQAAQAVGADTTRVDRFSDNRLRPEALVTAERAERAYAAAVRATEAAVAARNAEIARDKFRATADEATKATEAARGLARALKLPEPTTNAKAIEAIVSPAKAAASSLSTVSAALDRIDALPVAEQFQAVKASAGTLDEALKRVGAAAKSLDTLVAQKDALRQANTQFQQARVQLQALGDQVRASAAPNESLLKTFRAQQETVQRTAAAVQQAGQRYLETRTALREFGVDTGNVVAAQQQLASTAQRIIATQRDAAATAALRAEGERLLAEKLKANLPLQQALETGERKLAAARKEAAAAGADLSRVDAFKADTLRPEVLKTAERAERAYAAAVAATGAALDARKAQVARDDFRAIATNANTAAEAARGLARALQLPEPKLNSTAVAAIIQPAKEAASTLGGLATVLERVNAVPVKAQTKAQFDALRDSAAPLAESLRRVEQAAKGLDALNAQQAEVQRAGQAYADARAKLRDLSQQVASAEAPNAELKRAFEQQQAAVKRTGAALGEAATQFRNTRAALREFGVETRNSAAAGKQLRAAATEIVAAQAKVAAGTHETTRAFRLWGEGGRTTLSYAQRIRGEFLAMATSVVGLYSAIQVGQSSIDAASSREQTIKQLVLITGNAEEARVKYAELGKTADEVGVNFAAASKGYTDIAFAAREAGVSAEEVDRFYKNLLLTTRDLSLSGQQTERIFYAVSQIFSKNKLSSEELGQQLGESLKGILGVSAQAAGVMAKDFTKALEEGRFSGDAIIGIIDEYRKKLAGLGGQQDGYVQAQARFENALTRLKLQLADTGFLDAVTKALETLTSAANNGEFKAGVEALGAAFTGLTKAIIWAVENTRVLGTILGVLVAGKVVGWLYGIAEAMAAAGTWSNFTAAGTANLTGALTFLGSIPVVGWILAAVAALATLDKAFTSVHEPIVLVVGVIKELVGLFTTSSPTEWIEQARGAMARLGEQVRQVKLAWGMGLDEKPAAAPASPAAPTAAPGQLQAWKDYYASSKAQAKLAGQAQAGALKKIDDELEKGLKSANQKIAEKRGDLLGAAKEQYKELQDEIDSLAKRDTAAAAERQKKLDALIAATVRANTPKANIKDLRAANQAAIEAIKGDIEQAKADIDAGLKRVDEAFQDNLLAIEDYYAKRSDAAKRAEQVEVDGLLRQIALLETTRAKDPQAAKAIEDAWNKVAAVANKSAEDQRANARAAVDAVRQVREQFQQASIALDRMRGDTLTADMLEARTEYVKLLESATKLTGEERARAEVIAQQTYELRVQTAQLQDVVNQQEHLRNLSQAAVEAARLGPFGQAAAQQQINRQQLADLEMLAEQYRNMGDTGSAAYRTIQVEIVKLGAQTDLVIDKLADMAGAATTGLIQEMTRKGSNASDWFRAFGKSLADSLTKAFADEAAAGMANAVREALKAASSGAAGSWLANLFGGGGSGPAAPADYGTYFHTGGLVGHSTAGRYSSTRTFDPVALSAAVASAPRYHTGAAGLGLRSDEVMAVLKKREEVLAANDPRNILNGGAAAGPGMPAAPAAAPQIKIINTIDPTEVVSQGLTSAAGEKAFLNAVSSNRETVRKMLGVK